jgi:hypothetical protein
MKNVPQRADKQDGLVPDSVQGTGYFTPMSIAPGELNPQRADEGELKEKIQAILDDIDVTVVYKVGTVPQGYVGTKTSVDQIMHLIAQRDAAIKGRITEKLQKFTAKHDQPMRDEAIAVIEEVFGK